MGHVQKRERIDTAGRTQVRYIARWQDATGRDRSKTFDKKAQASKHLATVEAAVIEGRWTPTGRPVTVAEYAARWLESRPHRPNTHRNVESLIRTHITGTDIGAMVIDRVTATDVRTWATGRGEVLARSSARRVIGLLRSILAGATEDRLCPVNPVPRRVRIVTDSDARPKAEALTPAQVAAITAALPAHLALLPVLCVGTGLRIGEALGLVWSDLDLDAATLTVSKQLDRDTRTRVEPKTPAAARTVPLPAPVVTALRQHAAGHPGTGYVFTQGRQGRPYGHGAVQAAWRKACREAGVPDRVVVHHCRHTYASALLAAGVDVVTVAHRMGHADPGLTLSRYSHFFPAATDRTAAIMAAFLAGSESGDGTTTGPRAA